MQTRPSPNPQRLSPKDQRSRLISKKNPLNQNQKADSFMTSSLRITIRPKNHNRCTARSRDRLDSIQYAPHPEREIIDRVNTIHPFCFYPKGNSYFDELHHLNPIRFYVLKEPLISHFPDWPHGCKRYAIPDNCLEIASIKATTSSKMDWWWSYPFSSPPIDDGWPYLPHMFTQK